MNKSFVMLTDSQIEAEAKKGVTVYKAAKHDYGCASDDTAMTGIKHISVTLKPDGDYPFFTHPLKDLEEVKNIDSPKTIKPYTQDPSEFVSLEDYQAAVKELRGPGPGYKAMYERCSKESLDEAHKCFDLMQEVKKMRAGEPALWVHPSYLVRRDGVVPLAIDATLNQIAPAQIPLFRAAQSQGDPAGSFDKHMEYMQRNIELEKEIAKLKDDLKSAEDRANINALNFRHAKHRIAERDTLLSKALEYIRADGGFTLLDDEIEDYLSSKLVGTVVSEGAPYKQHPDIIGYARKKDLVPLLDRTQPDGSHITIGLDHPSCWEEEPPYEHLVALYTRPADLRWIDCNERMPEREVEVLVKYIPNGNNKDPIVVAALRDYMFPEDERLFWWNSRGEAMGGKVISWMVMPV